MKWVLQNQVFGAWQSTPLVVDGIMYLTQRPNDVLAVDAKTGRAFWQYRHSVSPDARVCCGSNNRGVAILGGVLYMGTLDAHLVALDAKNGHPLWNVTVGDLKGTVEFVFRQLLGDEVKLRFRPHYFSYTEPSFEIDFSSPLVRKMGKEWLEIAGCGMVHPQVFENVGYDPEIWSGWAFGFGIERIAMIRYGITDIRLFYENDLRFLRQF